MSQNLLISSKKKSVLFDAVKKAGNSVLWGVARIGCQKRKIRKETKTMENVQLYPANYMPTGFNQVINTNTGEVSDAVSMLIPTGSKVITPDQLEAIEKKKAKDGARRLRKMNNSELAGRMGFYFIPNSADFKGLSSATVTRLIYLNTFLDYDNGLLIKGGKGIRKTDLAIVLTSILGNMTM